MLVTTIRPRLAAMARTASIRSERPVPMVSTTTSHIRPHVTSRIRSNAATTPLAGRGGPRPPPGRGADPAHPADGDRVARPAPARVHRRAPAGRHPAPGEAGGLGP